MRGCPGCGGEFHLTRTHCIADLRARVAQLESAIRIHREHAQRTYDATEHDVWDHVLWTVLDHQKMARRLRREAESAEQAI